MSSTDESDRTRTYTWDDPMKTAARFTAQGGLEALQGVIAAQSRSRPSHRR